MRLIVTENSVLTQFIVCYFNLIACELGHLHSARHMTSNRHELNELRLVFRFFSSCHYLMTVWCVSVKHGSIHLVDKIEYTNNIKYSCSK